MPLACGTGACLVVGAVVLGTGALATALGWRKVKQESGQEHCAHCPGEHETAA